MSTSTRSRAALWPLAHALPALALGVVLAAGRAWGEPAAQAPRLRAHFDHTPVIAGKKIERPQEVTKVCLACHPSAASVAQTPHFTWLGSEVEIPGHRGKRRIGKKNLINNFCISAIGNEKACTKCHAGYGWVDTTFDFNDKENVDCLVCHEHGSGYVKGPGGMPEKGVDLVAAAKSVGAPGRENCLTCHAYGGGGQAVKHGDLDSSLEHPPADEDVHMGKHGFLCVDCHVAPEHEIRGRSFSVSVEDAHEVSCIGCHKASLHKDSRIEGHLRSVACQTCHIPTFARRIPTKKDWDWSKAGDTTRRDDPHHYLKIKGEFIYEQDAVPEYRWFNMTVDRYLLGDTIDPKAVTVLNPPRGSISDPKARIWPFKVHHAKQPYDVVNQYLLTPLTGGTGGYWTTFDWPSAIELSAKPSGLPFSGKYGFAKTDMYWPLSHMVVSGEKALGCTDCHGASGRLDWKALGYTGDPIQTGGRP